MTNQELKDQIYLALVKMWGSNKIGNDYFGCMKLDRLNTEELQLVLDYYKNPSDSNVLLTDPFKFRIVNDFVKKYPNILSDNPCYDSSKEAAIQKLKESMGNGTPVLPPNTGGIKAPPTPTPTKTKIPFIPIAIGLVVVLGVIIYIKKSK